MKLAVRPYEQRNETRHKESDFLRTSKAITLANAGVCRQPSLSVSS